MSTTTIPTSLNADLRSFFEEYGDELDTCNPNAWELLQEIITDPSRLLIEDFIYYYADELDACQPDAFDMLYDIAKKYDFEI